MFSIKGVPLFMSPTIFKARCSKTQRLIIAGANAEADCAGVRCAQGEISPAGC
jgi:hypothetical protein